MKSTIARVCLFLSILFCLTLSSTRPAQSAAALVVAPDKPDVSLTPDGLKVICKEVVASISRCECKTDGKATLKNLGDTQAIITRLSTSREFSQSSDCDPTLDEDQSCKISVRWEGSPFSDSRGELLVRIKDLSNPLTVSLRVTSECD
jgi:hypothetical protein